MKVKELQSILNTICKDNKKMKEYDVCISMDRVFTDMVTFGGIDHEGKRIMLEER